MAQRAVIAMALACKPALLIADEPTTALDVTIQAQILDLLREAQAELGMALLLVTHDLGVVAEAADSVAVMYAGRVVEQGPAQAVLERPAHPYTQALLRCLPRLDRAVPPAPIRGMVPALDAMPPGCAFAPRCDHEGAGCAIRPANRSVGPGHDMACIR
jgi:oligopeptide/dipeptide ABC transporter ATP-binding protein